MRVSPLQSNFIGGEISPLLYGRVETERYKVSLKLIKNYIPLIQGGLTRRPGSMYVAQVKNSAKRTRLIPFEFSTQQAYMLEFGENYIRVFRNNAVVESAPSVPLEVVTTYTEAQLFELKYTQNADVLFLTHPSHPPRKLSRVSHTSWTLTDITFMDGPYLPQNVGTTTLTPSATTGAITITASAATFVATDVGRLVRIKHSSTWGYARITAFTSTTVVNATVVNAFGATTAVSIWRLGVWSVTTGYPSTATFHEDRLFFAGCDSYPQRLDGSNTGDYENFAPSATDGTIIASSALNVTLNSNTVHVIRWLTSDEKGLLAGTFGGEWVIRAASLQEAMNAANISAKQTTKYGSANIQPVQVGKAALFVQKAGRKVRDMQYFYDVDGFRAADMTLLSEHITEGGITQLAFQSEPQQIIWAVRADGTLLGMTYERDEESLKVGWHRQELGGYGNSANGKAEVESVSCIPSADGTRDEVWIIVKRYINGATVRYVEYLTKLFEGSDEQRDAFFVDCGLTLDTPITITGATKANPIVISATAHGLSNGNRVRFYEVAGMTELNSNDYLVANVTANTLELTTTAGAPIDSSAYGTYISGGEMRKMVTTISGLTHLEGESLSVLADGAVHPNVTVTGGSVTLGSPAAVVHLGCGYNSDAQMLTLDAGSQDGTALGKTRRSSRVAFYLYRTLGMKIGMSFTNLSEVTFRKTSDSMSRANALYTGILSEGISADYDFYNEIAWRQSQPLPGTILAVAPQLVTQDRG